MIMPAFVLGNAIAAVLMRHTRSAMLQVLSSDYVRTARAKGLDERVVILKHALRNALMPIITLGALELGTLLSGAVLTEQVFTIPGFGKLIVDAVFNRDYAVVQGVVLFTATAYILLNLLADIAYFLVNPQAAGADGHARASTSCRAEATPAAAARSVPRSSRRRGARWSGSCVVVFFVALALLRAVDRAVRPARDELDGDPQGAVRRALVRHRRDRPRRAVARDLRRARVAARGRGVGAHLAVARRADRPARGLRGPLARRADLADDRRDARDARS